MTKKLTAIDIYIDWTKIKNKYPSYRLGQHYCNVLGLQNTVFNGIDLFTVENNELADKLFYDMCEAYQWDVNNLRVKKDAL